MKIIFIALCLCVSLLRADDFSVVSSTPPRVFTPNGDGINDVFTVIVNNPFGNLISQKKIYDVTGAEVADFQVVGDETALQVILNWDGKDSNGNIVPSGVYIYQIQVGGKTYNGTVVVAK